jgi:hypothetical protein
MGAGGTPSPSALGAAEQLTTMARRRKRITTKHTRLAPGVTPPFRLWGTPTRPEFRCTFQGSVDAAYTNIPRCFCTTHQLEVLAPARVWEFESPPLHGFS